MKEYNQGSLGEELDRNELINRIDVIVSELKTNIVRCYTMAELAKLSDQNLDEKTRQKIEIIANSCKSMTDIVEQQITNGILVLLRQNS